MSTSGRSVPPPGTPSSTVGPLSSSRTSSAVRYAPESLLSSPVLDNQLLTPNNIDINKKNSPRVQFLQTPESITSSECRGQELINRLIHRPMFIPKLNGIGDTLQPHPPSGKGNTTAFRTTMLRKDFTLRKKEIRRHPTERRASDQSILTVHRLHKTASNQAVSTKFTSKDKLPAIVTRDETQTIQFEHHHPRRESTTGNLKRSLSASTLTSSKRPHSSIPIVTHGQDPSIVLTYLKTNIYDDTVPENDDPIWHLHEMRSRLGWKTELPRHGPNSRKLLDKLLKSIPSSEVKVEQIKLEDGGDFVYCLPVNRFDHAPRYNPYHLQVVSVNEARLSDMYWTISASYVTRCSQNADGESSITTPAIQWLWERRLFDMIYDVPVFEKSKIRKMFFLWKAAVRHQKKQQSLVVMKKQLFCANEILQGCLMHIRALCESACGSLRGEGTADSAVSLFTLNKDVTLTLTEFISLESAQCEKSLQQLRNLQNVIVSLVWETCATVAEMEGITHGIRPESPTKPTATPEKKPSKLKTKTVMTKYGKMTMVDKPVEKNKGKPSYAQLAEWRKILKRLSEFLKAVDLQVLELLRRLVYTAVRSFLGYVIASFQTGERLEAEEEENSETFVDEDDSDFDSSSFFNKSFSRSTMATMTTKTDASFFKKPPTLLIKKKEETPQGYQIPHFDFDTKEEENKVIDADEILEEIRKRDEVIEIPEPIFSLEFILNVPPLTKPAETRKRSVASVTKSVTFKQQDDSVNTHQKQDAESDADDVDDKNDENNEDKKEAITDDEEEEIIEEEVVKGEGGNFAYPDKTLKVVTKSEAAPAKPECLLSPSGDEFRDGIKTVISEFEQTVSKIGSLLREPRLKPFYSPPVFVVQLSDANDDSNSSNQRPWPDVESLFGDDVDYQKIIEEIMEYLDETLEVIEDYSTDYNQYCTMVDKARRVNVEESMSKKVWTPEEFHQVLATHTEQVNQMNRMRITRRIFMNQINVEKFCTSCLPYPKSVLNAIHDKLPVIANRRNEDLLAIIKGALKKLDHFPTTVEEFVDHLSFLGKMQSEQPALEKEFQIVTKLFTISRDFDVKIDPEDYAFYQTLAPSFQHLKTTILFCDAKKDENIRKFSNDLDTLITDIRFNIIELKNKVLDPELLNHETMAMVALENVRYLQDEVHTLALKIRSYGNYQERFGSSMRGGKFEDFVASKKDDTISAQSVQSEISEVERDLTLRRLLWESMDEFGTLLDEWTETAFDSLNVENLQKSVGRFTQTVYMLEKGLPHNEVLPKLKTNVIDFKQGMPVITSLRNPSLKMRHWQVIEKIIGKAIARDKTFTLGNLLDMKIFQHKDKIQDISTTASNEATLEIMLQKVQDLWQSTDFRLIPHQGRDTSIIAGAEDLMAQLEESQVTIGTIRGSRYVTPIKGAVEDWERRLALFSRTLDEWMTCQRNWLYLEQIFSTPDIQRQLPTESKMFSQIDRHWKDIMRRTEDRPNALKSATSPGVLEMLQSNNANLEKIQKCLEDYLETKRIVFPRFYFLSNDDLLDILAQSKDPDAVQPHLDKCFGNIKSLEIKREARLPPTVVTMTSAEGETVTMPKNVRARGPVEQWLGSVENGMFDTVKRHLKAGLSDWQGRDLSDWVVNHPGQVVLTVNQIVFTKDVDESFEEPNPRTALIKVKDRMIESLKKLAGLVVTPLQPHLRHSVEAMLIINVHNRDVLNDMIENKIRKRDDFEWSRQLRYEWDNQNNNCNVLQSNAVFVYGYEYLGCSPRLVMTPLTDRCYLTLTGALHLNLGGSPAGPAGTGKTETVKDLAKAMGKQCVVFNCSEGLDFKMLGKFFAGLSQSGSWCCFDEFNRIDLEVLSVVAQQIYTIKTAKDVGGTNQRFLFEGREIKLNPTCGFFITMNPTYAGRVELPDNLKSLFRPVAMMVPDYTLIAEIMLFSEGFTGAKSLSRKMVNLYQLASKQLSQQDHYDFGMRAIKSVLVMAGQRKRFAQMGEQGNVREISEEEESHILIHALRDANLPKFLAEDVPLFESILADLFPGVTPPQQDFGIIEKAIHKSIEDQNLQNWPSQIERVKQLYSQILVRHGVMLVGPTGGGKTTVRSILQKALVLMPSINVTVNDEGEKEFVMNRSKRGQVEVFTVNPKCVKLGKLFGETDPNTFEWSDGLIAMATRKFAKDETSAPDERTSTGMTVTSEASGNRSASIAEAFPEMVNSTEMIDAIPTNWKWLVLDGPVDTLWVENLNTVLDDTKTLCLANGERISLTSRMRLMFEVDNLSQASPATISRCAMVYMDPVDLGWRPYVKTWLQRLPKDIPTAALDHVIALFEHSIDRGLNFVRKRWKFQHVPAPEMSLISTLCNILTAFFDFLIKHRGFGQQEVEKKDLTAAAAAAAAATVSASDDKQGKTKRSKAQKKQTKLRPDLETIADNAMSSKSNEKKYYLQRNPTQLTTMVGKLFVFAYVWSIGGNLKRADEQDDDLSHSKKTVDQTDHLFDITTDFDNMVREMFDIEPPLGVRLPAGNRTVFSYFIDMQSGNFVPWDSLVPSTQSLIDKGQTITIGDTMSSTNKDKTSENEIVPTVDTIRYSFLTALLLLNKNPVLYTGDSGVGKSGIILDTLKLLAKDGATGTKSGTILGDVFHFTDRNRALLDNITNLSKLGEEKPEDAEKSLDILLGSAKPKTSAGIIYTTLQFSAQTSASRTQAQIIHKLIKKSKDVMAGPKNRKVVVFVDDLNMPAQEQYGAQPPLELLRQFLDLGGFYDTKKLQWKSIHDVTVVSACGPPGGGRNAVSPRLLKHFCMLALPQPSTRSLQHIYQVQLGRFFQEGDFMPEVRESLFSLVSASIATYMRMCTMMKPTPAKSHYTFNIRDLSKVVHGLFQADETIIVNKDNCAQLLANEATRVFHDRLICHEDRSVFYKILSDNLHDYFKVRWSAEKLMNEPVEFGDFMDENETGSVRIYRPITDQRKLAQTMEEIYMRQNTGNTQASQMVFFKEAVEHTIRAARVFRQPGGHMLLVGMDGTGKSTTVRLACHVANAELYTLTLTRGYSLQDFRDDLKEVYKLAGVQGQNTVFLLTDSDIVKESFLEDINCILNSGEVPDLFDNEELDGIAINLKSAAAQEEIPDTREAVYQFFIQRVKKCLHVVLTMSPAGSKFRQHCRMNPSLINCCTIDWYDEWDEKAMLSVAQVYFQNAHFISEPGQDIQELKTSVSNACVKIHSSVTHATTQYWQEMRRKYYLTPSSYMELIKMYARMLEDNKTEFINNRDRLLGGLNKLSEANLLVGTMQDELVTLGPKIEEKAKETEVLLEQLEKDQEAVEQVKTIVEHEREIMQKETALVQNYADECQRDLASVLPALQTAIDALDALNKSDVAEIRVYQAPPNAIKMVMSAVAILLQEKPDWSTAKRLLGDASFLKQLIQFDKNNLPEKVFHKLKKYTSHPDFNPEIIGKVSRACQSICLWVLALEHYNQVHKMVRPKQKRVAEAKEALGLAQTNLVQKEASLNKIQEHLKMLQQQYQDSVNQREALKERKVITALRLQRASILITALSGEKDRWKEMADSLDFRLKGLVGDTLVSAAAVAYIGAFTAKYRKDLIQQWVQLCRTMAIPISDEYDLVRSIVDANQVLKWQTEALPSDAHSTENAVIVKKSRKWPLLIDPQGQAVIWITKMEGAKLKIVQASDPIYMRTMERAIRVGEPVLLQNVTETLDPSLKSILLQETFIRGGHKIIKLGDTEIEYNDQFRLYMTTSMGNPHYLPAVCIQVTLINFTVTFDGLQEQLLSSVVRQEKPELEIERSELLGSIANDRTVIREMEDKTLGLLNKSDGNILDDQDLVDTLQTSKVMSREISSRVSRSEETERNLNTARQRYLPVATRGATLYFVIADLAHVDVMYQFSLDWFQTLFVECINSVNYIESTPSSAASAKRLSGIIRRPNSKDSSRKRHSSELQLNKHMIAMIDRLTMSVFQITSVALFGHHQLTFSFLLTTSIMRSQWKYRSDLVKKPDPLDDTEWLIFMHGMIMASMMSESTLDNYDGLSPMQRLDVQTKGIKVPQPKWVRDSMWQQCQHLEATLPPFEYLCRSLRNNHQQWNEFIHHDDVYRFMDHKFECSEGMFFVHIGAALVTRNMNTNMCTIISETANDPYAIVFPWETLTSFEKILLIKVLNPAALTASIQTFIAEQMGDRFIYSMEYDLSDVYEESSAKTPIIFTLSPGSDPQASLLRFSRESRGSTVHLDMISLGRGQGPKAEELIAKAQILKGRWVFLQNCHLAISWMPKLQAIVEGFHKPDTDIDPEFRLFLSSKPDKNFPISILQSGLKMTVESPHGLKNNLMASFGSGGVGIIPEKTYESASCGPAFKTLLFGLCFFNAVIHERKKYGSLGWNVAYEFNDSDLEVSVLQLQMLLSEEIEDEIPWAALKYLTGEVTYGGRVTDDWDRRCLHSLLNRFYCDDALKSDYRYSPDAVYHPISSSYSFADTRIYIDTLPTTDSPEIFGMNENAQNAYLEAQAKDLLDTIITVQPRVTSSIMGSGKSNDDIVMEIATDIITNVPESIEDVVPDLNDGPTQKKFKPPLSELLKNGIKEDSRGKSVSPILEDQVMSELTKSALITVLRQEIDRFNSLLRIIHKSVHALRRAINGEVVMSEHLEEAYNSFLSMRVPQQWKQMAYESCKALSPWVQDLIERVDFFAKWLEIVLRKVDRTVRQLTPQALQTRASLGNALEDMFILDYEPRSFWLPAFFFPQGFLTGVLQNHARKIAVSVDSLTFRFKVLNDSVPDEILNDAKIKINVKDYAFKAGTPPDDGVLVCGLFIDGARWDVTTEALNESLPGQRFHRLPEIHFIPEQVTSISPGKSEKSSLSLPEDSECVEPYKDTYICPLYRTSARAGSLSSTGHSTNFVTAVNIPTDLYADFWVMRGVALLCQLDE
ncbi:dynein axonemal heavy chain 6-like [Tubulanus polymorphus]|uniref:dynein axonemal heavy chain 6-like n=1 Tax=Tubulanus polymorphus TaxID=672921 RepID=UPI003DA35286